MYRDGKRFSGVRWVVVVTFVPCLFRCGSITHILQLCGGHPIHSRSACICSNGLRNLSTAHTLSYRCRCLARVRIFCLDTEDALTLPQHVSVYMCQYRSHGPACCKIIPLQCSLSDSVLAWRCYVIFGKRRWLKWTLTVVVLSITSMCCVYLWVELTSVL
jgi:hypothetical protein